MGNKKTSRNAAARELLEGQNQIATMSYQHSGPIPDPITLERYENILPGAADRIIRMAENQSNHRQTLELKVIKSRSRDSLLGIIFGFVIALATLYAGTWVIMKDHIWGGTILGSSGLIGLVAVFIYGTRSARKEREFKNLQ